MHLVVYLGSVAHQIFKSRNIIKCDCFFATSLALAYIASHKSNAGSVIKAVPAVVQTIPTESAGAEAVPNETLPAAGSAEDVPN